MNYCELTQLVKTSTSMLLTPDSNDRLDSMKEPESFTVSDSAMSTSDNIIGDLLVRCCLLLVVARGKIEAGFAILAQW